MVVKGKVVPVL